MKHIIVATLLVLAIASIASADITTIIRGDVMVAAPTASTAWYGNPGALAPAASMDESAEGWQNEISGVFEVSGDTDLLAVNWGGHPNGKNWGVGAGYVDQYDVSTFGGGFGMNFKQFGVGVSLSNVDYDDDNELLVDLGVRGKLPLMEESGVDLSYGVVARDLFDNIDSDFDLGVYARFAEKFGAGLDWASVSDEDILRIGGTYDLDTFKFPMTLGVGLNDGNLQFGATADVMKTDVGALRVGLAYVDTDDDNSVMLGATYTFGQ